MATPTTNRVHYYHADACALGGYFDTPIQRIISPQAPMSISPSGGYGSARAENFRIEGLLSYKAAYTQVSGHLSPKTDHGWVTSVTSVIEGLNVHDMITADRLVSQITTEHPLEGDNPRVSFLGSAVEGFKVAGAPVTVTLDLKVCDQEMQGRYPKVPCVNDRGFLDRVGAQYRLMTDPKKLRAWVKDKSIPDWVKQRYNPNKLKDAECGTILTTVVKDTEGEFAGRPFGNAFDVPEVGRVFLGELLVDCKSYQLIMLRLELGCSNSGGLSAGGVKANGGTYPPS
jgi:hypothetical protein